MFVSTAVSQIMTISRCDICILDHGLHHALAYVLDNLGVTGFAHLRSAVCVISCVINGLAEYYIQIVKP